MQVPEAKAASRPSSRRPRSSSGEAFMPNWEVPDKMNCSDSEVADASRDVTWQIAHDCAGAVALAPTTTHRVVRLAVELLPAVVPLQNPAAGRDAHRAAIRVMRQRIRDAYQDRHGCGIIATLILSAIIQQVVSALIARWWSGDSSFRRQVRLAQFGLRGKP
jgi:hypothetical protein